MADVPDGPYDLDDLIAGFMASDQSAGSPDLTGAQEKVSEDTTELMELIQIELDRLVHIFDTQDLSDNLIALSLSSGILIGLETTLNSLSDLQERVVSSLIRLNHLAELETELSREQASQALDAYLDLGMLTALHYQANLLLSIAASIPEIQ